MVQPQPVKYRYFTENSIYDIDTENNVYLRRPRASQAFKAPELRNYDGSPKLVDDEWLPMCPERQAWLLFGYLREEYMALLNIFAPDSVYGIITSPVEEVQTW